jgi:hypothetical protein
LTSKQGVILGKRMLLFFGEKKFPIGPEIYLQLDQGLNPDQKSGLIAIFGFGFPSP